MTARTGQSELLDIKSDLSERDLFIIKIIADLRLVSGRQIYDLFFAPSLRNSAESASRATRRSLARLVRMRILVRLNRQIGGVRAGSKAFVYGLGVVGHRLLERGSARPRYREPSVQFVDHTLAIAQLVVSVTTGTNEGPSELLAWQSEPICWRTFGSTNGQMTLRPDLYLSLGLGDYEYRYFVEIDRDTEHIPAIVRKARLYDRYYRTGHEQSKFEVFPTVLFVVPSSGRARAIDIALRGSRGLTSRLFSITTDDEVLGLLLGGRP
jgi:hypothetical protein